MAGFKLTYATMFNPPEELHKGFDKAVAKLKANLGQEYGMIIDGQDVFADDKFDDHSPINTDWVLARMQKGNATHANMAIAAARKAFPAWSHTPWQKRVQLVRKAASLLEKRIFELGAAMALEVGKNRMELLGDVQETADLMYFSAQMMEENEGFIKPMGKDPLVGYDATQRFCAASIRCLAGRQPVQLPLCVDRAVPLARRSWRGIRSSSSRPRIPPGSCASTLNVCATPASRTEW